MIQVSEILVDVLKNHPALTAKVQQKIFPVIAPDDVSFPFAVYGLSEVPYETKDACVYNINVAVWFERNNITEAMQMTDDLKALIESEDWDFINTGIGFDADTEKIYSEINFKIVK